MGESVGVMMRSRSVVGRFGHLRKGGKGGWGSTKQDDERDSTSTPFSPPLSSSLPISFFFLILYLNFPPVLFLSHLFLALNRMTEKKNK